MTEKNGETLPKIKVTRKRKRLYEPVTEDQVETQAVSSLSEISPEELKPATSKETEANDIIMDYVMWSAGTGLIPVPLVDMMAMTVIELKMLKKLTELYRIKFSEHRGKSLIASLIGGVHAGLLAGNLLKFVPVFGLASVILPMPFIAGAITYAVGKVFVQHFEAGGTLLDFNPPKMEKFFAEKYKEGHLVISDRKKLKRK